MPKKFLLMISLCLIFNIACATKNRAMNIIQTAQQQPPKPIDPLPSFVNDLTPTSQPVNDEKENSLPNDNNFSFNAFVLIASLQIGEHRHALLLSPHGKLVEINHGDYIGKEHAQVVNISADAVEVQLNNSTRASIIMPLDEAT